MKSRLKTNSANCFVVLLSLIVGLILLELIIRPISGIAKPYDVEPTDSREDIRYGVLDVRGFWTWKPLYNGWFDNGIDFSGKHISTYANGTRAIPCLIDPATRGSRIFLLGDSQTFGWGLSDAEAWANQLQCRIEKSRPRTVAVVNMGFPGTQVDQYYARGVGQIEDAINASDTVVVSFTWNDLVTFGGGEIFVRQVLKDAGLRLVVIPNHPHIRVEPINKNSAPHFEPREQHDFDIQLMNPTKYKGQPSWRYSIYKQYGIFIPLFDSLWSFVNSLQYVSAAFRAAWSNARLIFYRLRPEKALINKISKNTFQNNFLVLKALETRLRRKGARVLIQLLPSRLFFDDFYYQAYSKGGVSFADQDFLGHIAQPFCKSLDLICVNRFEELKTRERDLHTFPTDGHYNQTGAMSVAKALFIDIFNIVNK